MLKLGRDALSFRARFIVLALLAGGCANDANHGNHAPQVGRDQLPQPPVFLTGPAAVLLARPGGFIAHIAVVFSPVDRTRSVSGELAVRGAKFFFTPAPRSGRQGRAGQFSYIWDAISNKGYILSEALQGCAPINSSIWFTNRLIQDSQATTEKVEGHLVEQTTSVAVDCNGKQSKLEVARARDLGDVAIRIASVEKSGTFTITLSQVRLELPSENLFLPPDGFTEYANEAAMMNELDARQGVLRSGGGERLEGAGHTGNGRSRHSRTGSETESY